MTKKQKKEPEKIEKPEKKEDVQKQEENKKEIPTCGIVMPISPIDGCTAEHWTDVREILTSTILKAGFSPELVSESDEIGIIHKRIIQNLYNNPILVCDVSAKNLNVMFELGMRLAFDKPTIVIKDDTTLYSFDLGPLEYIEYPRDLRYNRIEEFKEHLQVRLERTYQKSQEDPNYSTFLKDFGNYKIADLQSGEISSNDYIIKELRDIKREMSKLQYQGSNADKNILVYSAVKSNLKRDISEGKVDEVIQQILSFEITRPELHHSDILLIAKRFKEIEQNFFIGISSHEEYRIETNKIKVYLLKFIDTLDI